ncbi:uncharacterized protein G2W53_032801 [Senna tora]|uniref:Uncharacterized protein n=1 Tax=Senna tora TaxID=362788 RepID=A0A834SX37_9FABA|nr:uncharacterized protein G2W53_032801 [Senna tora]
MTDWASVALPAKESVLAFQPTRQD